MASAAAEAQERQRLQLPPIARPTPPEKKLPGARWFKPSLIDEGEGDDHYEHKEEEPKSEMESKPSLIDEGEGYDLYESEMEAAEGEVGATDEAQQEPEFEKFGTTAEAETEEVGKADQKLDRPNSPSRQSRGQPWPGLRPMMRR